jgi:putative transposase
MYYGPGFTSRAFIAWTQQHGIEHLLIEPGRPMQNGYIESFNGKFRDECLNEHWFTSLAQAREVIADWRRDYNQVRPHSSCGRIPPSRFAANYRAQLKRQRSTLQPRALSVITGTVDGGRSKTPAMIRKSCYRSWARANFSAEHPTKCTTTLGSLAT